MDIEFHYYITYLVAARAGFDPQQASVIAYASQYVDDNDIIHEINVGLDSYYSNYISQTMNIFKPKRKLLRIYPLFHLSLTGYQNTHWFKFQEAVKAHQKAATEILKESTFGKMELEHW